VRDDTEVEPTATLTDPTRVHSFSLTVKTDCKNYINRLLYKDIY